MSVERIFSDRANFQRGVNDKISPVFKRIPKVFRLKKTPLKMSLLPYILERELRPHRMHNQDFGLGIRPDDFLAAVEAPLAILNQDYYRPWRQLAAAARDVGSTIKSDKDQFQINLDVQHFSPEEISVKTVDGYIVVEGKHEEKEDEHGFISRQFVRRYALPQGCDEALVQSRLSSDGVLTVQVPKQAPPAVAGERVVPIQQTGPVKKQASKASKM